MTLHWLMQFAQNVSHLIILSADGVELHKIPLSKRGSMSPPTLADIDNDNRVEIIISLKDLQSWILYIRRYYDRGKNVVCC